MLRAVIAANGREHREYDEPVRVTSHVP
jgi:hypothetical protein